MKHLESEDPLALAPHAGTAADATARLARIDPRRIVGVLWRRGWLVALLFFAATAAMWLLLSRMQPVYRAHGAVYVSTSAPGLPEVRDIVPAESKELEQLQSVANGMRSSTLLLRVIERTGLAGDPEFKGSSANENTLVEHFADRVGVELRRGTRIIDIRVEDPSPGRARDLVQALKEEYEILATERQQRLMEMIGTGLDAEEQRLRARLEESEAKVAAFREAHPIPGIGGGPYEDATGGLSGLRAQLTQVRSDRLRAEAELSALDDLDQLESGDPDAAPEVATLLRLLRDKQVEFARVKERYMYKHPVYKEIASEIARVEADLAAATQAAKSSLGQRLKVLRDNEAKLVAELEKDGRQLAGLDRLRADFAALTRAAEADRELHATVERRLRETGLANSVPSSVLRWEETPLTPSRPVKPRKPLMLALAGGAGMFLGLVLAVILELCDRRLRDPDSVIRSTGMPMLAEVPRSARAPRGGMVLVTDPGSEIAESFRRLRAVLAADWLGAACRTTLFTSVGDGEGKSFCALNHAASLAIQGYRTLLIDADLRQRGLSRDPSAGDPTMPGLGDYLAGTAQPAETCILTSLPGLYLMAAGKPRDDAAELLADNRMAELLRNAFHWFDRVVIDIPAVLKASDVQSVARFADRTCLVLDGHRANLGELRRATGMLSAAGARLAGFIWNHPPRSGGEPPFITPFRRQIAAVNEAEEYSLPSDGASGSLSPPPG
jgi:capsular exopolysaccharide synthesis family protein